MDEKDSKPNTKTEQPSEKPEAPITPEQLRAERIGAIKQGLDSYEGPQDDRELEMRAAEIRQQYERVGEDLELSDETKQQLDENMRSEIVGTQERRSQFQEQRQKWQVLRGQELVHTAGGKLDPSEKPYKRFNPKKHERFLIQKGEFHDTEAVFKVGEAKERDTIQNESKNLRVIDSAPVKPGENLDIHFVREIGDVFEDDEMVGLATEYIQDNPELKRSLSAQQKVEIIGRTIKNLQKLSVTDEARERGLPSHDGEKIVRDAQHFLDTLLQEGRIDSETVSMLQETFRSALPSLMAEQPVFVHGDVHGDNIFVDKTENGELDISLLDFEGLRISNQYHDWSEILNKSTFLKHLQANRSELFDPIKNNVENMWLDESVAFDEQAIIDRVSEGDPDKVKNFRLTRAYDMLTRIVNDKNSGHPVAKERVDLYLEQLREIARQT